MRIGVIGTGTIASAVVEGIAGDGHHIAVSRRSAVQSARLSEDHENVTVHDNQAVLDRSDVIFLGLMANAAAEILDPLTFRSDQRVISLMADCPLERVAQMARPARAAAVMIPFPGIAQGGSPALGYGDTDLLQELFGARNTIFALKSEGELAAYNCAQAVLSPSIRMVADAADWLGARIEDHAQGEAFLRALVGSSLMGSDCATLLAALDTPGGYNQRLRNHMDRAGMNAALATGLDRLERDK
ncbi:NAD(P)-binding domain-containing protein [Roseovarius dicentrarchi]|uniref:NAD(P)-binding domain-containing protein n=1 Tax=Roseovarius dicentrarchi TaxID=2250573 RepID=UPI001EF153EA|nr:NAD(P)-binding domain-containing protein [Roseovarius dicentrarchi]